MSKDRDRTVYRRNDGKWANKRNDSDRAASVHDTQKRCDRFCQTDAAEPGRAAN